MLRKLIRNGFERKDAKNNERKGRAGVTLRMENHTHVKPASSNDTSK